MSDLQRKLAAGTASAETETVAGVTLAARNLGDVPPRDLKGMAEAIGQQIGSGVAAVLSTLGGKLSIVVGVFGDQVGRVNAVDLVRAASSAAVGACGGGRPDLAQAGGPDATRAGEALEAVRRSLAA